METTAPKVSVLMSVYNGADYLQEAIDSILGQTFADFEFIIFDDCSTDESPAILIRNAEQDARIVVVKNPENLGLTKSLNKGLQMAKGQYIARQDADDVSLPQRFEKLVEVLDADSACVLASCNFRTIDQHGNFIREVRRDCSPELVAWHLLFQNRIAGHSQVMFRRDTALEVGSYDENCRYSQDYELWSRLTQVGKITILPGLYLDRRIHDQCVSSTKRGQQEAISLSTTQKSISKVIKQEISMEQAKTLRQFWKGYFWYHDFPPASQASFIHSYLKTILREFVAQNEQRYEGIPLSETIQGVIDKQFLLWLSSPLTSRHSVWSKLQISRYCFTRKPVGTLKSWLTWLVRLPYDTALSVGNKLAAKRQSFQELASN